MQNIDKKLDNKNGILLNVYAAAGYYALGANKEHWEKEFKYWVKELRSYSYGMSKDFLKRFEELKEKLYENLCCQR